MKTVIYGFHIMHGAAHKKASLKFSASMRLFGLLR